MARLRPNFASGKLTDASISATVQQLNSPGFANLPLVASPDILVLQLDPLSVYGAPEIVTVTDHALAATVVTVERGMDGPIAYTSGSGSARAHNQSGVQEDWYASATDQDFVHSTLYGLSSDDHPQYLNETRHQEAGEHNHTAILYDIFFPGFTMLWPGPSNASLPGWLWCNGQAVSVSTYNPLYQALGNGTIWGQNTTAGTFNLPPGGQLLAASGGAGNLSVGALVQLLTHLHALNLTSSNGYAFPFGHLHSFAAGVDTGAIAGGTSAGNHHHGGVTVGTGNSGGQSDDHWHGLGGVTTDGSDKTGGHSHSTSGNTANGSSGQLAAVWNLFIHV